VKSVDAVDDEPEVDAMDLATVMQGNETWERDSFHFSERVPPLVESFNLAPAEAGTRLDFAAWSLPMESFRLAAFDGWVYSRVEPFGGEPSELLRRAMAGFPALAHAWRVDPKARRRILSFERFVAAGGFEENVGTWEREWEAEARHRLEPYLSEPTSGLSDDRLVARLVGLRDHLVWVWSIHANIHFTCFYIRGCFADFCQQHLDLTASESYDLLRDCAGTADEPLHELAARVRDDPHVLDALGSDDPIDRLAHTWFPDAFHEFLRLQGYRTFAGFDITKARWHEDPALVLSLIRQHALNDSEPTVADDPSELTDRLRHRLEASLREEFDRWLALGRRAWPLNESHEFLLTELPEGLVREAVLEAGERLCRTGALETREDVFFLYLDELLAALSGADVPPVDQRKEQLAGAYDDPPAFLGPVPEEPPLHALPPHTARALRVVLQQLKATAAGDATRSADGLSGTGGSPGIAEGRAVVVLDPGDVGRVGNGDILVCRITTPAWSVVFPRVAGLVTDEGGMLSHAAIVAHEYRIPAVVGTQGATQNVRTGDIIHLNGTTGEVKIVRRAEHNPPSDEREGAPATVSVRFEVPLLDQLVPVTVPLAGADATAVAGMKAKRLGDLITAGFNVPDGFVVTTGAYARAAARLRDLGVVAGPPAEVVEAIHRRWLEVGMPDEARAAILEAYRALGRGRVAVRSSAIDEDLEGASFAGQYESILDVDGEDEVVRAVIACWSSLWNERAVEYRVNRAVTRAPSIAVVVQRMAPHAAAGVAFTRNPVTLTEETVVNAVAGSGEALVSGEVTPDQWRVDPGGRILERSNPGGDRPCLHDADVTRIADLARRVEAHYGGVPQDVEWSVENGEVYVLQARPISTWDPDLVAADS
jgi:rifampicin phosphotransferase